MESWIERTTRGVVRVGALVLLVCLALTVNSLPTPTFKAATGMSSTHQLYQNHHSPTQSTVVAKSAMSWDDKTATTTGNNMNRAETRYLEGNNQEGVILSTVQTSREDNDKISTRRRRMSSRNTPEREYEYVHKQMHCRNGYLLAIYNETINGTSDKYDLHTHLWIKTVRISEVTIRGVLTEMYICMDNRSGRLYPQPEVTADCIFKEEFLRTLYAVFSSQAHEDSGRRKRWYIGLGNNGRPRLGRKTKRKHSTTHFLVESVKGVRMVPDEQDSL